MSEIQAALIKIEHLQKVFYTDEVETHALSEVSLTRPAATGLTRSCVVP